MTPFAERLLVVLHYVESPCMLTNPELCELLELPVRSSSTNSTMQRGLESLIEYGYAFRIFDPKNGRRTLYLTESGRNEAESIIRIQALTT